MAVLSAKITLSQKQEQMLRAFSSNRTISVHFDVATGEVLFPTIQETRTEADFKNHIKITVASGPDAEWIFVVDQLNTHKSESVVLLVASLCEFKGCGSSALFNPFYQWLIYTSFSQKQLPEPMSRGFSLWTLACARMTTFAASCGELHPQK